MDDVWDDGMEDADHDALMAGKAWGKLQGEHGLTGYREGTLEAKDAFLQEGFDGGFAIAAAPGKLIGTLQGKLSALLKFGGDFDETTLSDLKATLKDLKILSDSLQKNPMPLTRQDLTTFSNQDPTITSATKILEDLTTRINRTA
ncbi:hypothetical protein HDU67_008951 [Dinochytrium kinnereticum]|nr:hypothetical protein HDU67_008951 [Dinochytrium kinnereticum]